MRVVLSIILSLFLVGCFSQSLDKVGTDIVNSLNNEDYGRVWDKYIDEDTKAQASSDLEVMKSDPTSALMFSMLGIPEDKIESLTSKELFEFTMNLTTLGGDTEANSENLLIYGGAELIDENNAIIVLENDMGDDEFNRFKLVKIKGKWYLGIGEDTDDTVEVEETVEEIEVK